MKPGACYLCEQTDHELVFDYDKRPEAETDFGIPPEDYRRQFWRCRNCGLMTGVMELDPKQLYEGAYVDATYSGKSLGDTFARIMGLPPEQSDNVQRVARVNEYFEAEPPARRTVLDVGSGLGVFPARMKEEGWEPTALDPDPRAVEHIEKEAAVKSVRADFMQSDDLGSYSLVTLNKVLEHVEDPVAMLERCRRFLEPDGTVYLEVPDGERAAEDPAGSDREEFYIEHLWAFSEDSLRRLAKRAGFEPKQIERLREPSDKYTLFAFLQ